MHIVAKNESGGGGGGGGKTGESVWFPEICMFYSVVLHSPALLFFPSTLSLLSNPQHEFNGTANNTYLQSTLQAYFYFYMIAL